MMGEIEAAAALRIDRHRRLAPETLLAPVDRIAIPNVARDGSVHNVALETIATDLLATNAALLAALT